MAKDKTQGFGKQLGALFEYAIRAGKRVRPTPRGRQCSWLFVHAFQLSFLPASRPFADWDHLHHLKQCSLCCMVCLLQVRSETSIASGAVSVSSAAAELAQLKLPSHNWSDAKVCAASAVPVAHTSGRLRDSVLCRQVKLDGRTRMVHDLLPFPRHRIALPHPPPPTAGVCDRRRQDVAIAAQAHGGKGLHEAGAAQSQHAPRRAAGSRVPRGMPLCKPSASQLLLPSCSLVIVAENLAPSLLTPSIPAGPGR